jgi:predicted phage tail protein
MVKVHLKGRLGQEFTPLWELDVKTPKEALHAINVNTDGRFIRYIEETNKKNLTYAFMIGDIAIDTPELVNLFEGPASEFEDIVITPVVGGSFGTEFLVALVVNLIISVVLAVVSAMLAPSPNIDMGSNSDTARKDSYLFSGGPQPARQGKPVPVGYGRMIVYPIAISVQYEYSSQGFGNQPSEYIPGGSYNDWGSSGGYYNQDSSRQYLY